MPYDEYLMRHAQLNETELRRVADELFWSGGYWNALPVEALMGWLLHGGKCVYCDKDLVGYEQITGGKGTIDYLLPHHIYPELDFMNPDNPCAYLNAVPACGECRSLKGSDDTNTEVSPQLYGTGRPLTVETQRALIERGKNHVEVAKVMWHISYEADVRNWDHALHSWSALVRSGEWRRW